MKATVKKIGSTFNVIGLDKPALDTKIDNGKETYEMMHLYSFPHGYKTLANAVRAIAKKGLEYVDYESINTVVAYD